MQWPTRPLEGWALEAVQDILRRDDVVRTSCPGPNDVIIQTSLSFTKTKTITKLMKKSQIT